MAQTNLTIEQMHDQILGDLQNAFGNTYAVEDFPGDPASYQLKNPNGAILLIMRDRKFDAPQTSRGTMQLNYPTFWISMIGRNLRDSERAYGVYGMLDAVRQQLRGKQIGVGYMYLTRESLGGFKPGGVIIMNQNWTFKEMFE